MPQIVRLNVDMKSSTLSVGEVAERFGLATHVLRHWESVGLLKPARAAGSRSFCARRRRA
ncbi:MerR family DNA-binding transcriptional regulator [Amycolatopsis coloradensis]|uniref:MerR family DNA-binding transcriptional regulator n=1 Tax=Amycolatopsis coloradensis TaxID=76021 RepID=A0ACD5BCK1_9PSEU